MAVPVSAPDEMIIMETGDSKTVALQAEPDDDETGRELVVPEPRIAPIPDTKNNIYVLDLNLNDVGSLEDLALGERIFAARFLGNRAYLVTFRQVDPLFVIDLSNPGDPHVLGQLKIPGFSDYLHPYDESHIIGIGKDVAVEGRAVPRGVKLSLFDVSDVKNPVEKAQHIISGEGTQSEALQDHKAFLFSKEKNLLVIPILLTKNWEYTYQGAYVFDLTPKEGFQLKGRITHADGNDKNPYWYFSPSSIRRTLYIGGTLYTISSGMVKATDLDSMGEVASLDLPVQEEQNIPF